MKNKNENKKKQSPLRIFQNTAFMFKTAWKISPRFFLGYVFDASMCVLWNILDAWYIKQVFDMLDKGESARDILIMLMWVAIVTTIAVFSNAIYWCGENERQSLVIKQGLHIKLFNHALSLDIGKYEIPEFYNDFIFAIQNADVKVTDILDVIRRFIQRFSSGAAVLGIMLSLDVTTALFIIFVTAPAMYFGSYISQKKYEYEIECRRSNRIIEYVNRVHYMADYSKELRISEAGRLMDKLYDEGAAEKTACIDKYFKKISICGMLWNMLGAIKDNGIIAILLYKLTVAKTVALGGFALGVTSAWQISNALKEVTRSYNDLEKHSLYVEKLRTFLAAKTSIEGGDKIPKAFESLECKSISFAYENGVTVLKDVSLKITAGEKIAIVGYNGAGKTTLIKLLMRFYDVSEGEILLNGINIKEYKLDAYRKVISAVFQDYRIFAATVAENVAGGIAEDTERAAVLSALEAASFKDRLAKLERGVDTPLTREFDEGGTNLSGGESQKIAIARALYKKAPITVMDEPSSALDPIAEYELNLHIENALCDSTVIFISHRLSTTRSAARIYMFDSGRITEVGSHAELMANGKGYAEMFNLQASKYRD